MWIWYSLLFFGVCHLAHSTSTVDDALTCHGEKLAEEVLNELKEHFGPHWEEKVPELIEKLNAIGENLQLEKNEDKPSIGGNPWENTDMMLRFKWKKVLHKVGHVAGKIAIGAASNIAAKAVMGALGK
uniref:Venom protein family 16 protein 1 n=1 Tax=Platymeris rhadamanthus TaxID=1134088 RepID=F16P1_PLARH|nr:RecName: Full=Venom protein family 16 protein 1; Short=f16p1; Flags: Precursor [Platymeris rhadamanthus]QHB21471.1 venom protein family 16 protein 1 [Platymeris rhadamanthus]